MGWEFILLNQEQDSESKVPFTLNQEQDSDTYKPTTTIKHKEVAILKNEEEEMITFTLSTEHIQFTQSSQREQSLKLTGRSYSVHQLQRCYIVDEPAPSMHSSITVSPI